MRLPVRRLLLLLAALVAAGALVYAFLPAPVEVDVAPVTRGPLQVTVDADGKTRIKERYVVAAPLAGRLLRVDLHPGDAVTAGKTPLASIEPADPALLDVRARAEAEARVRAAEAAQDRAEAERGRARQADELARHDRERARQLAASHSASREELERVEHRERMAAEELRSAEFALRIAAFELEQARAALLRTRPDSPGELEDWRLTVLAPIDGRVLRVFQESATVVSPGTRLLELGEPADLEAEIDVLSADAVKVRPGARVLLERWGGDRPLQGRVRVVEPAGYTKISALGVEEQRVWVIVGLTDPPEARAALGDAYRVEARIVTWEGDDVLKAPAGAVFRHGDGWAVFLVRGGRAGLRPVQVGQSNGLETEILAGLEAGDRVIVHPGDRVRDGVVIRPR
jgi:HlyD family secretion protein